MQALLRLAGVKDAASSELAALSAIAIPVLGTYILGFSQAIVSQILVGHVSSQALASAALANMYANACGNSIIIGTASAVDTLASQAYGAQQFERVGRIVSRGVAVGLALSVPVAVGWYHCDQVLSVFGQPEEVISMALAFVRALIVGLPASVIYEVLKKHLTNIGHTNAPLVCNLIGLLINIVLGYVLVYHSDAGYIGAPIATVVGQWCMLLFLLVYFWKHTTINASLKRFSSAFRPAGPASKAVDHPGLAAEPAATAAGISATLPEDSSAVDVVLVSASASGSDASVVRDWAPLFPVGTPSVAAPIQDPAFSTAIAVGSPAAGSSPLPTRNLDPSFAAAALSTPKDASSDSSMHQAVAADAAAASIAVPELDLDQILEATMRGFSVSAAFTGWREYLQLGIPSAAMLFVEWGSYEATSLVAGHLGTEPLAVHTILATTASLAFMPILGFGIAVAIRIGNKMGERKPQEALLSFKVTLCVWLCYVVIWGACVLMLRGVWGHVFTDDPSVLTGIHDILWILAIYTIFDAGQCIVCGAMRGLGRPGLAASANVAAYVVIGLPCSYAIAVPGGLGVLGIWVGYCIAVFAAFILLMAWARWLDWSKESERAFLRATSEHSAHGGKEFKGSVSNAAAATSGHVADSVVQAAVHT